MSNYTKTTDFAAKDALLTGNPSKLVKGTEINVEFSNIQTAVNSKLDSSGVTAFAATLLDDVNAATARGTLGAAESGANADITSMTGLSNGGIPLVKVSGAAASGANADITSMTGLSNGGVPVAKVSGAAVAGALGSSGITGAAASGANTDITSLGAVTSINGGQLAGLRNRIINGNFGVNQRAYTSGGVVGANLYGHDRWKMAASGDTYTFSTTANVTTVTIPADKVLQQVIEGLNLETGTYTLSWVGTAQGKIGAGSYGASGITGAITGGTNTTIEFGPGTVSKVQLEFGSTPTVFEQRPYSLELFACRRYLPAILSINTLTVVGTGQAYSTTCARVNVKFTNDARVTPTGVFYQIGTNFSCTNALADDVSVGGSGIISIISASAQNAWLDITGLSGLVAGDSTTAYMNTSGASILFTGCEL